MELPEPPKRLESPIGERGPSANTMEHLPRAYRDLIERIPDGADRRRSAIDLRNVRSTRAAPTRLPALTPRLLQPFWDAVNRIQGEYGSDYGVKIPLEEVCSKLGAPIPLNINSWVWRLSKELGRFPRPDGKVLWAGRRRAKGPTFRPIPGETMVVFTIRDGMGVDA